MIKNEFVTSRMIKGIKKLNRYYTHYNIDLDYQGNEFVRLNMIDISEIETHDNKTCYELTESYKQVYTPLNYDYSIDKNYLNYNIERSESITINRRYYSSLQALYFALYNSYEYYQLNDDNIHQYTDYKYVFDDDLIIKLMFDDISNQIINNRLIINSFTPFIIAYDWDIRHVNNVINKLYERFGRNNLIVNKQFNVTNNSYTIFFKDLNK